MNLGRALAAFRMLVRRFVNDRPPCHDYLGIYRFRVVEQQGDRVSLEPVSTAITLAPTLPIELGPGMAGLAAELTPGAVVAVAFVDGDPTQPFILSYARSSDPAFLPVTLSADATDEIRIGETVTKVVIGPGSPPAVGRVGDAVSIGTLSGTTAVGPVSFVFTPAGGGAPSAGPTVSLSGEIAAGSTLLSSA